MITLDEFWKIAEKYGLKKYDLFWVRWGDSFFGKFAAKDYFELYYEPNKPKDYIYLWTKAENCPVYPMYDGNIYHLYATDLEKYIISWQANIKHLANMRKINELDRDFEK